METETDTDNLLDHIEQYLLDRDERLKELKTLCQTQSKAIIQLNRQVTELEEIATSDKTCQADSSPRVEVHSDSDRFSPDDPRFEPTRLGYRCFVLPTLIPLLLTHFKDGGEVDPLAIINRIIGMYFSGEATGKGQFFTVECVNRHSYDNFHIDCMRDDKAGKVIIRNVKVTKLCEWAK